MGDGESDGESEHGMRITAICLRRRPDRWAACEEHLLSVVPERLLPRFDMFAGTDAAAAARGESPIDALEARTGCRVYRGWPIQEVSDVHRCYPQLAELPETQVWLEYERCFSRVWRRDRARLYVDFFCRHLTLGDVGAALSHLRVAERAHAEGVQLQLVLEDDATLLPDAIPALLREVRLLKAAKVRWDLIYLGGSAQYCRAAEPAVGAPGSCLRVAGHRKVCMAYALSAEGARKLATCGYRASILPVDDLLPALHSFHPRDDVRALPCVRAARGERGGGEGGEGGGGGGGEAGDDGDGDGDGEGGDWTVGRGFTAFTFADDAALVSTRRGAGSDSKAGAGSAPLLGDCGTATDVGDEDGDAAAGEGDGAALAPSSPMGWEEAMGGGLSRALRRHGHCRVHLAAEMVQRLREAELEAGALLALPETRKKQLRARAAPGGGPRPRDCGGSDLWNCGYSAWECRQQWHLVCGAADAQPWPEAERPSARATLLDAAEALRALALCCLRSLQEAEAGGGAGGGAGGRGGGGEAGGGGWAARLERQCAALGDGSDPSVLDAFAYRAEAHAAAACHMASHTDPGLLTLTLASETAGLQARSTASGAWVDLEAGGGAVLVVLAAEQLERASGGAVRAAPHRVVAAPAERLSLVYELRLPEERMPV